MWRMPTIVILSKEGAFRAVLANWIHKPKTMREGMVMFVVGAELPLSTELSMI